ncbi:MAG: hypothetical protein Q7U11_05020, partial [Phenylobacterium sp.]|nr:hypothetical protein [Phenylobacterium sp.]
SSAAVSAAAPAMMRNVMSCPPCRQPSRAATGPATPWIDSEKRAAPVMKSSRFIGILVKIDPEQNDWDVFRE